MSVPAASERLVAKLRKTRTSLLNHSLRDATRQNQYGGFNARTCELFRRYNNLILELLAGKRPGDVPEWAAYCRAYGSHLAHTGVLWLVAEQSDIDLLLARMQEALAAGWPKLPAQIANDWLDERQRNATLAEAEAIRRMAAAVAGHHAYGAVEDLV